MLPCQKGNMFRTRRLRKHQGIRRLVKETKLSVDDFVYPLFIEEGENIETEIVSMPGIKRWSLDTISKELDEVVELNIPAVLLFGIPSNKDDEGTETWNDNGIMQQAIRFIKKKYPSLYVITDVCFCEYTSHGHCGIIHDNDVDNDATLVNLAKQVISHAKAGVDMVAPSGMMDGTIDMIATDHAPHTINEKGKGMKQAPFGVVGLETAFPLIYTNFVETGIASLYDAIKWFSYNPAKRLNLPYSRLLEGRVADITVIDLQTEKSIDKTQFASKGKNTPFDQWVCKGWPIMTLVEGQIVYKEGEFYE